MEHQTLHDRLQALGHKIHAAEERLHEQAHLYNDRAHLTAKELKDRYAHLQARLTGEVADAEAYGDHVTDLERSMQQWLESYDTAHVASK